MDKSRSARSRRKEGNEDQQGFTTNICDPRGYFWINDAHLVSLGLVHLYPLTVRRYVHVLYLDVYSVDMRGQEKAKVPIDPTDPQD